MSETMLGCASHLRRPLRIAVTAAVRTGTRGLGSGASYRGSELFVNSIHLASERHDSSEVVNIAS